MVRRAMAHRLAVTTDTQAKNTDPFFPLGTVGLAWTRSASQAIAGWEPSGGMGSLADCGIMCLSPACPSGVEPQSTSACCHLHDCHTCCCDGQGQEFPLIPGHEASRHEWPRLCSGLAQ